MQGYEVIEAKTPEEAEKKSKWKVGDKAQVIIVHAVANSNGTFSVFPEWEKVDIRNPKSIC